MANEMSGILTRRQFLRTSAALAAAGSAGGVRPAAAQAKERISIWAWGEASIGIRESVEKAFEAKYPSIDIELTDMGPWDLMDKLYASLASGSGAPDVSEVVRRMFSKYGERGGMVDLTERIAPYKNDVLPTAWMQAEYGGKIWGGMPDVLPGWVVYNREVFERFGVKPGQLVTWDDVIAAGREMKKAGVAILHASVPAGTWGTNHWTMFLNSRRGNIFTPEGKVIRNNELAKQMFRWYFDLQEVAFQTPVNDPSTWVALKQGKLATYTMNVPSAIVLKKQAPELSGKMGLMPWPLWGKSAPKDTGQWGGTLWVIPKQSKHPEAAWKFVEFLCFTVDGAAALWKGGMFPPAYTPALKSPVFNEPDPYFGGARPFEVISDRSIPNFYFYDWQRTEKIIGDEIDTMLKARKTPEKAWEDAEARLVADLGR